MNQWAKILIAASLGAGLMSLFDNARIYRAQHQSSVAIQQTREALDLVERYDALVRRTMASCGVEKSI